LASSVPSKATANTGDPVADPRAIIVRGDVRFTVLTSQMIRLEWSADAAFEDHASIVFLNRKLPVPPFETRSEQGWTVIDTGHLQLRYREGSGRFTPENLSISLMVNGKRVVWKPGTPDTGNLCGTARTLDRVDGADVELEAGLLSRDGWVVVDDSNRPLLDNSEWPWAVPRVIADHQDLYFFGYGHDYKRALGDFTRVAGKIPLPPRFAFGNWWSRYWPYTDQELVHLVDEFKSHDVPLDVLVIDMDWHLTFNNAWAQDEIDAAGQRKRWTGYTWNPLYFPDPEQFLDWAHRDGLKVSINLHPASGVQPHEAAYPEFARAMGIDSETNEHVRFDIANRRFADNYFSLLHHPLEKQGIDFFWLDWQQENETSLAGLNPTFWLNHTHFTDMERRGKRALLFHRWGGLGNHRYQIGFSGDTVSSWASLGFQPYFTATASNVGYGYWSHDIGGHKPGEVDPELYTRWVQFGAFSPILRTHTSKNPDGERRIWAYPLAHANAMRSALLLRHALIPYIYTAARQAYDTGISMLRPMYYDHPDTAAAYEATDQYMFGDDILVAPIARKMDANGLAPCSVWLPEGEWIEWFTGARMRGPGQFERMFTLDEIPVYVKAGAIIPMQDPRNRATETADPLILKIFPGEAGSTKVYEDQGDSLGYQGVEFCRTSINAWNTGRSIELQIGPVEGSYPGMAHERGYRLEFVQTFPPECVTVNGHAVPHGVERDGSPNWRYDGATLTAVVTLPRFDVQQPLTVKLRIGADEAANLHLLSGTAGRFARLRRAMDIVNSEAYPEWSPDSLIEAVQTSRRITLHPAAALQELSKFWKQQENVLRDLRDLTADDTVIDRAIVQVTSLAGEARAKAAAAK
jgi:alpha-glucosidase (family GH31 glycosyl hydrolase)